MKTMSIYSKFSDVGHEFKIEFSFSQFRVKFSFQLSVELLDFMDEILSLQAASKMLWVPYC